VEVGASALAEGSIQLPLTPASLSRARRSEREARQGARKSVSLKWPHSLDRLPHPPGQATGWRPPRPRSLTGILRSLSDSRHRTSDRVSAAFPPRLELQLRQSTRSFPSGSPPLASGTMWSAMPISRPPRTSMPISIRAASKPLCGRETADENSPTGNPHLQGEWRRRESNPRPRTHREEPLQACPAIGFRPPAGSQAAYRRASHPLESRSGRLALPRRQARCWRRIPSHGPKTERRRYLTRLGGECEIVLRTCFVPGCFTRPTGDLGLQLFRRTDHVETRSPPEGKL